MGKSTGSSETTVQIPEELKPIYSALGQGWSAAMQAHPMVGPEGWYQNGGREQWGYGPFGSQSFWQAPYSEPRQNPLDVWTLMADRFARRIPNPPESSYQHGAGPGTAVGGLQGATAGLRRTPRRRS